MILKQSLLNLLRNKKRTAVNVLGVLLGVFALLVIGGYYEFTAWGLRESLIRSQYGHLQLYASGFGASQDTDPFARMIADSGSALDLVEHDSRIRVASPRIEVWGSLHNAAGESRIVQIIGAVPNREALISTFLSFRRGRDLNADERDGMEIGKKLADDLGLALGDVALITIVDAYGFQNTMRLAVRAITGSYSADFDARMVRIPLALLQDFAAVSGVQSIVVLLADTQLTDRVAADLRRRFRQSGPDLELTTWYDHAAYFRQVVQYYAGFFRIILLIIVVVVFFSIMNTMALTLQERLPEVGALRSFGTPSHFLLRLFLAEGAFIGIAGGALGSVGFLVIKLVFSLTGGFTIPAPPGVSADIPVNVLFSPQAFLASMAVALVVPMIAVLFAVARGTRLPIIRLFRV